MSTDLRQKLIDAGLDESPGVADAALTVFADWLRDEATEVRAGIIWQRGYPEKLEALADSITTPKGEHG